MRTEIELDMVFIANLVHELALVGETVLFYFYFFVWVLSGALTVNILMG